MKQLFATMLLFLSLTDTALARYCENDEPPPLGCHCAGDFVRCPKSTNSNRELIENNILGKTFCYEDEHTAGWIFTDNWQALQHGIYLGRPGPNSYYTITYTDSLRTLGIFDLENAFTKQHFSYTEDGLLLESSTNRILSVKACRN